MTCQPAQSLEALRADIDRIDEALLALMERRLSLSRAIAAAKAPEATAGPPLRLDREEAVIERLAARTTAMPAASIAAVWRELMGLNLQAQRRTVLAIHAPRGAGSIAGLASGRFGAAAPVRYANSAAAALDQARRGEAVAIVELDQHAAWWRGLKDDPELVVIAELRGNDGPSALAVARIAPDHLASGRRWLVIEEAELAARIAQGETICPLAASGTLRLCILEDVPALLRLAA